MTESRSRKAPPFHALARLIRPRIHTMNYGSLTSEAATNYSISTLSDNYVLARILDLPYDILLEILLKLPIRDLISISMVCRTFHMVSSSGSIWSAFAYNIQNNGSSLTLDNFTHPSQLSDTALKHTVVRTLSLSKSWLQAYPEHMNPIKTIKFDRPVGQYLRVFPYFISENIFIASSQSSDAANTMGWMWRDGLRFVGIHSIAGYTYERSEFVRQPHGEFILAILSKVSSYTKDPALVLVAIHLQTTSQDAKLQVTPITRFSIKGNLTWLRVATNPSKNMICLLLRDTILSTFKIFLLNWKTKFSTIIDTAIIHARNYQSNDLYFSDDSRFVNLEYINITTSEWVRKSYRLDEIEEAALKEVAPRQSHTEIFLSASLEHSKRFHDRGRSSSHDPNKVYYMFNVQQHWPKYEGVRSRRCHVIVYRDSLSENVKKWSIAQFFSPTVPYDTTSLYRWTFDITDPAVVKRKGPETMGDIWPLIGVSFNHMAWIEQFEAMGRGRPTGRKLRQMKFMTFPMPEELKDGAEALTTTLKIPKSVLELACHISVEPSLASVIVTTSKNEMHRFQYA